TLFLDANGNTAATGQPVRVSPLIPTTYNVVSVASGSTCIDTIGGSATITPFYNLGITTTANDALCNGSCDGIGNVNIPAGTNYSYLWPSGTTLPTNSSLCAGNYWVTLTEAVTGCSDSFNIIINEPTPISVPQLPDDTICDGVSQNYTVTPTGGVGGYTYNWIKSNVTNLGTGSTVAITGDSTSNYTLIVTDANNCPAVTQNFTVFVRDTLSPSILSNPPVGSCAGDPVVFVGNATGGDGNYSYNWNYPGGPAMGQNIVASPTTTTTFSLTVSDVCGSTPKTVDFTLLVDPIPSTTFIVDDSVVCPSQDVTFSLETFNSNYTYLIEYGDFTNDTITSGSINHAYNNQGCQDVTITVITVYCTVSDPWPCRIDVLLPPIADYSWSPVGAQLTNLNPQINLVDQSFDGIEARWFEDSVLISSQLNFTHAFSDTGLFEIKLVSINDSGCTDTIASNIQVISDFTTFYIPNAFSPNGDNANETFGPIANIFITDNYSFKVYDRWGDRVFETSDINTYWNGRRFNDGDELPQGVYVYAIEFFDRNGREQAYRGHLTLFR
ncbi:MAG: gliding motility-associated C-terminal domain-containing protein, partial [Salibacteraceae bacterium]